MGNIIGLKRGTVKLVSHNKQWRDLFGKEKNRLLKVLPTKIIIDIQHAGSTAIPDTKAKPILDIAVGMKMAKDFKKVVKPLKKIGYRYVSEFSPKGRHLFIKGGSRVSSVHLHAIRYKGSHWFDLILFRDFLKDNKAWAKKYSQLKEKLYKQYKDDRPSYTSLKNSFIKNIIQRAKK